MQVAHLYDRDSGECLVSLPHPCTHAHDSLSPAEPSSAAPARLDAGALAALRQALLVASVADRVGNFAHDKVACPAAPHIKQHQPA